MHQANSYGFCVHDSTSFGVNNVHSPIYCIFKWCCTSFCNCRGVCSCYQALRSGVCNQALLLLEGRQYGWAFCCLVVLVLIILLMLVFENSLQPSLVLVSLMQTWIPLLTPPPLYYILLTYSIKFLLVVLWAWFLLGFSRILLLRLGLVSFGQN